MSLAEQPTLPKPTTRLSPAEAYANVVYRVELAHLHILRARALTLIVALATALLFCFATLALLDWQFELSGIARCLAVWTFLLAGLMTLKLCWRKWITSYTLERAAVDVEHEIDEFGQGLRTALDYQEAADRDFAGRPALASPGLLGALHQETYAVSERAAWQEVKPARWLWQATLALLLLAGTCLIALAINSELQIAAGRMLLFPWQYTQVTFEPQMATVKQGESVVVKVEITGRPLKEAHLCFGPKDNPRDWVMVQLLPADSATPQSLHGSVQTKLANLQEDTLFEVIAGPIDLPAGHIRVLQPLTIQHVQAEITPPAYTKKPATIFEKTYDLRVWEGSQVDLHVTLNRPAATASMKRIDGPKDQPAVEHAAEIKDDELRFHFVDLRASGTYELTAVAEDEIELPPQKLKIQVTLDRKPSVKWVQPEEQWEVTPTTEVTMAIAAEDDLGVHKAGIAVQIGSSKVQTLWETDAQGLEQLLAATAALLLEERGLSHKDSVTYHAFVEDNYFDKPRRTTTPLRFIDIRPYQQNFQLVEGAAAATAAA